jgi:hypothetical protein
MERWDVVKITTLRLPTAENLIMEDVSSNYFCGGAVVNKNSRGVLFLAGM